MSRQTLEYHTSQLPERKDSWLWIFWLYVGLWAFLLLPFGALLIVDSWTYRPSGLQEVEEISSPWQLLIGIGLVAVPPLILGAIAVHWLWQELRKPSDFVAAWVTSEPSHRES